MAFISTTISSRYPTTNNQLRTSSNPRNQATIQDGRVIVQQVQGRQSQSFAGNGSQSNATSTGGNRNVSTNAANQTRVMRCYNFWGDGHMAIKCTQPKRPRNADWFKEKILLTDDLDAFDSDSDEAPFARAVLMANLSGYDLDVLLEVVNLEHKTMNETLTAELERYKEWIKQFKDRQNVNLNDREKYIDPQMNGMIRNKNAKKEEKKALDNIVYKVGQSVQTMHMLTKPQVFYDNTHKQALGYQNPFYLKKAQGIKPTLYDGSVLTKKHDVMSMVDSEEKLILAEESRSKEIEKQNDSISKEKNVNICPINYADLNKLSEHFGKHFVPQKELFAEQAFWLPISNSISEQLVVQPTLVKTDIPRELPKVIEQYSVDNKCFEIQKKELIIENDRLLELIISQDIIHIAVNSLADIVDYKSMEKSYVDEYNESLKLKTELSKKKDMIEQAIFQELSNKYS
ncbi:hypothetical protein Tco_0640589 [Tanacetum coccineum]